MLTEKRSTYLKNHKQEIFNKTFCELFHETVLQYPGRLAIEYESKMFTYKELDEITDTLATYLIEKGIMPGEIVAVRAGQTMCSVVSMIAAWKAGCAYVYIDSTHPEKRQKQIMCECECRFILDQEYLSHVDLKKKTEAVNRSRLEDLAVIVYTSGSTSSPKGVMLSQQAVSASISNFDRFGLSESDVFLVFPSFSFVASVFDLYSTLLVGATLDIIPKEIRKDIHKLKEHYIKRHATVTFLPPHMAKKFNQIENGETELRVLVVGSEMARNLDPQRYQIFNVYGSSEMTALIACYDIKDNRSEYPIGKLNEDIKGYIVDDNGNPVPQGEQGELWLSSLQMSCGYYKSPEKTEKSFVPNPFTQEKGYEKVFKTNDLVRMDKDGNLEFCGRKDFLYKIRGFRVEASAVETAMLSHENVKEAVAKAFMDSGGTNILVGYVVSDVTIDPKELKEYIKTKLPYYMVPTAIIQLDAIPRNANNKVNRNALVPPAEINDYKLLQKLY